MSDPEIGGGIETEIAVVNGYDRRRQVIGDVEDDAEALPPIEGAGAIYLDGCGIDRRFEAGGIHGNPDMLVVCPAYGFDVEPAGFILKINSAELSLG